MKRAFVLLLLVALILGVLAPVASACEFDFCDDGDKSVKSMKSMKSMKHLSPYTWDPVHPSGRWIFLKLGLVAFAICHFLAD
jgi:hypothetical protein